MAVTTSDAVYRALVAEVSEAVSKHIPSGGVYLSDRSVPDTAIESCVQIVPGGPESMFPRSGTGGVKEMFEITVWKRVTVEPRMKLTEAVASATQGVIAKAATAIRRRLKLNSLGSRLHVGLLFIRSSKPSANQLGSSWVAVTDTYEGRYELDDVEVDGG